MTGNGGSRASVNPLGMIRRFSLIRELVETIQECCVFKGIGDVLAFFEQNRTGKRLGKASCLLVLAETSAVNRALAVYREIDTYPGLSPGKRCSVKMLKRH